MLQPQLGGAPASKLPQSSRVADAVTSKPSPPAHLEFIGFEPTDFSEEPNKRTETVDRQTLLFYGTYRLKASVSILTASLVENNLRNRF